MIEGSTIKGSIGWERMDWIVLVWFGLVWIGLDWFGLIWIDLDWIGMGLEWFYGQFKRSSLETVHFSDLE